jgi:eukaryotic-like serine/threonine-protein kinase
LSDARSPDPRVRALLDRYIEEHALHGETLDLTLLCREDPALLGPLAELVEKYHRVDGLLAPPSATDSRGPRPGRPADRATLLAGARLGPYEIVAPLGAGGMGEIFRANDTRLDRAVAVKVLSRQLSASPDLRRRFEREARVISSLKHPHICALYDLGREGETEYLVLELLEGESLAQRLTRGALPLADVLRVGMQIADALAAAHGAGVVHRDLKPGNVFLTLHGAKLLDFGLAKLHAGTPPVADSAGDPMPAVGAPISLTGEGVLLGTLQYMAPEQLEGREADARSDLFALGAVLYEMVTGARAFTGDSRAGLIASILHQTPPPVSSRVPLAPPALERVVATCLEKDPEERWRSAHDIRVQLGWIREAGPAGAPNAGLAHRRGGRRRLASAIGVAALAAALSAALFFSVSGEQPPAPRNAGAFAQLTSDVGLEAGPSLSPDGRWFVYVSAAAGNADIYLQAVGGQRAINLTADSPEDDTQPAFSHDGDRIAFRSERDGGGLFVMGGTGEGVRRLTTRGFHPSWSPDDREVVYSTRGAVWLSPVVRGELAAVTVATGRTRPIPVPRDAVQPSWSPNGLRIAFASGRDGIWTIRATADGEAVRLIDFPGWNPVWSRKGAHVYFASDRGGSVNLWKIALDATSGEPLGEPQPITVPSPFVMDIRHAAASDRLLYSSGAQTQNVHRIAFDAGHGVVRGEPLSVTRGTRTWGHAAPSNDGQWIAGAREGGLFVARADGSGLRQIGLPGSAGMVSWSHDSRRIAFSGGESSAESGIWTVALDGSDLRLVRPHVMHSVWSPDGRSITFHGHSGSAATAGILDMTRPEGLNNPDVLPALASGIQFDPWAWSPDGRSIAGNSLEYIATGKHPGIVIYTIETRSYETLTGFGGRPSWSPDGRWIAFSDRGKLHVLDLRGRGTREILALEHDHLAAPKFSGDGGHLYFHRRRNEGDIWMVSFDSQEEDAAVR